MSIGPMLAVIPARGGSKGLPKKNLQLLAGLPLIAHAIRFAALCGEIARCVVSTDSAEIASVAREHGASAPFIRPSALAADDTPMWPVLQHALEQVELLDQCRYGSVLLLSPASPARLPEDISKATELLESDARAVGVISVSRPPFNPRWVCVDIASYGYMRQSFPDGMSYVRRQDVPAIYRINGSVYLWRRDHVATAKEPGYFDVPHRVLEVPEARSIDIDTIHDLRLADLMLRERLIEFPWL